MALFHNEPDGKGGRRFVEVTETGRAARHARWSTSAGWADLDGDGFPDLYVCHYVDWSFANHPVCARPAPGGRARRLPAAAVQAAGRTRSTATTGQGTSAT